MKGKMQFMRWFGYGVITAVSATLILMIASFILLAVATIPF